jgi:hypothetical protein
VVGTFTSVISSSKEVTLVLVQFYRVSFRATWTITLGLEPRTNCLELRPSFLYSPLRNKQLWSGRRFSIVLFPSYRIHSHGSTNPGQLFGVTAPVPVISSSKQTTLVLAPFYHRAKVSELQDTALIGIRTKNIFWSFNLSKISSWYQGISMPSLVKFVYTFSSYKQTHTFSF